MASAVIALVLSSLANLHLSHGYTIDRTCYGGLYGEEVVQGIKDALAEALSMAHLSSGVAALLFGDAMDNTKAAMFPNLSPMGLSELQGTLQHEPALVTTDLAAHYQTLAYWASLELSRSIRRT
jgi:hypothetical protein